MTKFNELNDKLIFVCYDAGAGGERLSVDISRFPNFRALTYYVTDNNRTIITNDIFEKIFLFSAGPFERLYNSVSNLDKQFDSNEFYVVPSHWDVNYLEPVFPRSKFIRIISPDNPEILKKAVEEKIFKTTFHNFLEFVGFCKIFLTDQELKDYLATKKINHRMTVGEIYAVMHKEVKRSEFYSVNYNVEIDQPNVLNIAYNSFDHSKHKIQQFIAQVV